MANMKTVRKIAPSPLPDNVSERDNALVNNIFAILASPSAKEEDFPPELFDIPKMRELHAALWGTRKLASSLSKGELDYLCEERGYVVGALKAFQSNLKHLTWQAQRIASGEYHHRVNFLGDFSVAFNQMAEQLGDTINNLTSISEEYKDLSHKDPLTCLYNRNAFFQFCEQILARSAAPQRTSTLIMADIDKFKDINDTYGHLSGDEVLKNFAKTLLSVLRPKDICCRYGGEEFVILMPETCLQAGVGVAERLRRAVENMVALFEGKEIKVTASFGLCEVKSVDQGMNFMDYFNACLQIADVNLYKAKAAGRNCVVT